MRVIVDASVAVKWFVPEIHGAAAFRLLQVDFTLTAPDLLGSEVTNTFWKMVRRGEVPSAAARDMLESFADLQIEYVPTKRLLPLALDIATTLDRTVYDSLYLALAVSQDCPLFTADRKFYNAARTSLLAAYIRWVEEV